MAIKVITGKPGSGKSYFALYKVILEGFTFHKKSFEWRPIPEPITIITNIEGLKVPHLNLTSLINEYADGAFEKFFTVEIQQKITDKYPKVRYLIDECQRFFHSKFYNKDVFFYFQYHRHLGHDIYMIAQVWDSVSKHITGLCEYEFRASPRSFSIFGEFTYYIYAGFDRVGSVRIPVDKKIFALYQSFQAQEHGKEIRPVRKFALITVCLIALAIGGSYLFLQSFSLQTAGEGARSSAAAPLPAPLPGKSPEINKNEGGVTPGQQKPSEQAPREPEQYALQFTGGFFVGDEVKAIQWNGTLIPAEQFPYQWSKTGRGQIQVFVPASAASYRLATN